MPMLDIFEHYGYERFDELLELKVIHIYDKLFLSNYDDDDEEEDKYLDLLYKLIDQSTVLEELHFNENYILLYDGEIEDSIAKNTALKLPLTLSEKFVKKIAKSKTIKVLNLYDNRIDDEVVKHLADALKENNTLQVKENKTLKELYLHRNNIGDEGAKYIGEMLAVNKSLQEIGLSNNNIGDEGAKSIAASLPKNTTLHTIRLRNNKIGDQGAKKLADALEGNHSIKDLELGNGTIILRDENRNDISNRVMNRIQATLKDQKRKEIAMLKRSIAKKDKELEGKDKEIRSLKNQSGPLNKRAKIMSKIMSVQLDYDHIRCSICTSKFSADLDNKDEEIRKHLPVLSASSKTCDHYFCHGCILKQQASIAEENNGKVPKWLPCMVCKTKTAFCPSEPKYHRLLIDILKKADWVDAPQVKEEPTD